MMMDDLTKKIKEWAIDRKLDCADPNKQMLKLGYFSTLFYKKLFYLIFDPYMKGFAIVNKFREHCVKLKSPSHLKGCLKVINTSFYGDFADKAFRIFKYIL